MKTNTWFVLLLALLGFAGTALAQAVRINSVEPPTAKTGETVTAKGESLDSASVDVLYLTDGTNDIQCEITSQSATQIAFKVPEKAKGGRWALMVHTRTQKQLIEQPVKLTVE